jgi:hypothetical protein
LHLANWTVPVYLQETAVQKIHVEESLSFPEVQKRYFELQPKVVKVTYAQAAASCPSTTETYSVPAEPETGGLRFTPTNPGYNQNQQTCPKNHKPQI